MTSRRICTSKAFFIGVTCFALIVLSMTNAFATQAPPPNWMIDQDQTSVTFSWTQMGAEFTGELKNFEGYIYFDITRPEEAEILISFPMAYATTGSDKRDKTFHGFDWFHIENIPNAFFRTDKISIGEGDNQYLAKGHLEMKNISRPIDLPFTLTIENDIATATGRITLDRLDWNIGIGEWRDTSIVKNEVNVEFSLIARRITADAPL